MSPPVSPPARGSPALFGAWNPPGATGAGSAGKGHVPAAPLDTPGTRHMAPREQRRVGTAEGRGEAQGPQAAPGAPGLFPILSAVALSPCAAEEPPRRAGDWSAKNAALISELIFTPSLRPICRDLPAMRSAGPGRGSAAVPAAPRYGRGAGGGGGLSPGGRGDAGARGAVTALSPPVFESGPRPALGNEPAPDPF